VHARDIEKVMITSERDLSGVRPRGRKKRGRPSRLVDRHYNIGLE
jgi:hypothetical protein